METDAGKIISRKFISGPLFQTEKKTRREPIPTTNNEIQPKNRRCLRGLDGKYGPRDEILRDILNGKLKIVQNRRKADTDTEEEVDDGDDEEMPKTTGRPNYDTSERNGRYVPIHTNPEEDAIQIHTDREIPGENTEKINRRSSRNVQRPNRYGSVPYTGHF